MSFSFGKYKGQTVEAVAKSDPSYLRWLMIQPFFATNRLLGAVTAALKDGNGGSSASTPPLIKTVPAPVPVSSIPAVSSFPTAPAGTVSFGKYKGQAPEVMLADKAYCQWLTGLSGPDFFKRNALYERACEAAGVTAQATVATVYSSGSSGFLLPGNDAVTFGKYKGQALEKMLADADYCAWVVEAATKGERPPRNYDKIVEAAKKSKPKSSSYQEDDPWEPPEDDFELDDDPWEPPEDEDFELNDTPLEVESDGEVDDTPWEPPEDDLPDPE